MKTQPAAIIQFKPFELPVFDPNWKQKCLQCAHALKSMNDDGGTILRCAASVKVTRTIYKYCFDVYDTDCITEKLFTPAQRDV